MRNPDPNAVVIAASSMKTALWVKDGPPLVPAVKPTTVKVSGPVAVIICTFSADADGVADPAREHGAESLIHRDLSGVAR